MSNVVYEGRGGIDWWSRLMSLGSLAVAGAALWFAYRTYDQAPSRDEALSLMKASIDDAEKLAEADRQKQRQAFEETREQWQAAVDEQLKSWRQVAYRQPADSGGDRSPSGENTKATDGLAADDAAAATDASKNLQAASGVTPIPDALSSSPETSSELTSFDQTTPDESMPDESMPDESMPRTEQSEEKTSRQKPLSLLASDESTESGEPDLRVVRTALKSDRGSFATVSLRNAGSARAVVTSLAFEPAEIVEVDEALLGDWPRSAGPGQWIVSFLPTENMALAAGDQGAYFKQLPESQIVEPGAEVQLIVAIANTEHVGWGLVGNLTLDFATSPSQNINDVRLVFLAAEQP